MREHQISFPFGRLVSTAGVNAEIQENEEFKFFSIESLAKFLRGDWGQVCEEDKETNDDALKLGNRLVGSYEKEGLKKLWIITEADRSTTTLLFPSEY